MTSEYQRGFFNGVKEERKRCLEAIIFIKDKNKYLMKSNATTDIINDIIEQINERIKKGGGE
jgi:predicted DNA-binding protein (UPF0278 family)